MVEGPCGRRCNPRDSWSYSFLLSEYKYIIIGANSFLFVARTSNKVKAEDVSHVLYCNNCNLSYLTTFPQNPLNSGNGAGIRDDLRF